MKCEPFISNGKIYVSVSFTAQEMELTKLLSSLPKKENLTMANKSFSIQNHGLTADNIYTLRYTLDQNKFVGAVYNDLINLNMEEMIVLRDILDTQVSKSGGFTIEDFAAALKSLAKRFNVAATINTENISTDYDDSDRGYADNPSSFYVGDKKITNISINRYSVDVRYSEEKRVSA